MIYHLLLVGLGGFFGSVSRYAVYLCDRRFFHLTQFPLATLVVNLLGSLLIGIALGLSSNMAWLARGGVGHYLFVSGFLGAFTTFSTFSQDNIVLWMDGRFLYLAINIIVQVAGGFLLAYLGYHLASKCIA